MKLRRSTASQINNFPDIDYGGNKIDGFIENEIATRLDLTLSPDWTIIITLFFCEAPWVGVFKRTINYPSTKEKELSIAIPIPNELQARYGLSKKRFGYQTQKDASKYWTLAINYTEHATLKEFIVDSAKRGVEEAFLRGVVVEGNKIKLIT